MAALNREKIESDIKTLCSYITTQEKELENAKFQLSALELFLQLNSTKHIYIPQCIFSEQIKFQPNYFHFGSLKQIICEITKKNGKAYFTSNDSNMKSYFNINELESIINDFSIAEGCSLRFEATCESISASQLLPTSILNFPATVVEEIKTEKIELPIPSTTVIEEPITISIPESQLVSVIPNNILEVPVNTSTNTDTNTSTNADTNISSNEVIITIPENNIIVNDKPITISENNIVMNETIIDIPENTATTPIIVDASENTVTAPITTDTSVKTETIIITIPNNILIDDEIEIEEPKNIDTLSCTSLEDMAGEITAEMK